MRRVAALYLAALVLFLSAFGWSWAALPSTVATHFDSNGTPNGWIDRTSSLVFMAGMGVLALGIVPGLGALAARHPGRYINVPNRRYWLRPENQPRFRRMFTALTLGIGAVMALLLSAVNLALVYANSRQPATLAPPSGLIFVVVIGAAAGLAYFNWRFRRSR